MYLITYSIKPNTQFEIVNNWIDSYWFEMTKNTVLIWEQ